jgi:hypothetical protein
LAHIIDDGIKSTRDRRDIRQVARMTMDELAAGRPRMPPPGYCSVSQPGGCMPQAMQHHRIDHHGETVGPVDLDAVADEAQERDQRVGGSGFMKPLRALP